MWQTGPYSLITEKSLGFYSMLILLNFLFIDFLVEIEMQTSVINGSLTSLDLAFSETLGT